MKLSEDLTKLIDYVWEVEFPDLNLDKSVLSLRDDAADGYIIVSSSCKAFRTHRVFEFFDEDGGLVEGVLLLANSGNFAEFILHKLDGSALLKIPHPNK